MIPQAQGGGGGVVSICKHVQNHDGRIIVDAFLHPKNRLFFHSNILVTYPYFVTVQYVLNCTQCKIFRSHISFIVWFLLQ